jgi:hypothetical protein
MGATTRAFWASLGIHHHDKGTIDPDAKAPSHPSSRGVMPKADAEAIAGHMPSGRDPRSPSSGPYAYTPPSVVANVNASLTGAATVKVGSVVVQVSGTSIAAALKSEIVGVIEGLFRGMSAAGTNGDSGHDGRAGPVYPDHAHG